MYSSNRSTDESTQSVMLVDPLPPYFLGTQIPSVISRLLGFYFSVSLYFVVYLCYIARYGHVRNGHRMLVTYIQNVHIENSEHRNLEIRKHVMTSLFRYETFLLLLS